MAHGLDLVETEQAAAPAASAGGGSNWVTVGVTPATTQCQKPLPVGASGWKAGDRGGGLAGLGVSEFGYPD